MKGLHTSEAARQGQAVFVVCFGLFVCFVLFSSI